MVSAIQIKRRAVGQAMGAPAALKSGELAINFSDNWMYIGAGDDGAGNATSILRIAGYQKFLELNGDQSVAGVKTFSASPLVPTPTTSGQAVNKGYVDSAVANAGGGDMMRSTYDANGDGIVDRAALADSVAWNNVSGKPAEYPPANHDASKITSGTIDPARLPILPSSVQVVSSGGIANLTTAQQNEIGDGSVVTTTDGRRWIYTGTGSKTSEASYIILADITPEWEAISNKPTTLAGYGITDSQPLDATLTAVAGATTVANSLIYFTGADAAAVTALTAFGRNLIGAADAATTRTALGLGTLATQNSSNVSITGGTLDNVIITNTTVDGGQF